MLGSSPSMTTEREEIGETETETETEKKEEKQPLLEDGRREARDSSRATAG